MLDCTLLQHGKRYLFRGKYLTYQHRLPGGSKPRYVFATALGSRKELSQEVVSREVWEPVIIDTSKLEAFNE